MRDFSMGKRVFALGFFAFFVLFLSGCSMMPKDEEIINGSINESEIFFEDELSVDDVSEVEEKLGDYDASEGTDENDNIDENEIYEETTEIGFKVVD